MEDDNKYIKEYVGKSKFDDYYDEDGNLIRGAEIELYRTYPRYLTVTLVTEPQE